MVNIKSLSAHIRIGRMGHDERGNLYLSLRAALGDRFKILLLSLRDLAADPKTTLATLDVGLISHRAREEFIQRVQVVAVKKSPEFFVVDRSGWSGDSFVLPNGEVIGGEVKPRVCLPVTLNKYAHKFTRLGNLSRWARIPELADGNDILMTALGLASSGPVVDLLAVEPPWLQIVGRPGAGKTGTSIGAGSFWGASKVTGHFLEGWNQTTNNIEVLGAAHHATFLSFDDTKTFRWSGSKSGEAFFAVIVCLSNGIGTGRMTDAYVPPPMRTPALSTSNASLDELARAHRYEIDDAIRGRLIEVPLPRETVGAFENLHGYGDHAQFTAELVRIARENHGVAAYHFILNMSKWMARDRTDLINWLNERRDGYLAHAKRHLSSMARDLMRVHDRFATIYASGRLAIELKLFPWSPRAYGEAVFGCECAHVTHVEAELQRDPHRSHSTAPSNARLIDTYGLLHTHIRDNLDKFVDLRNGLLQPDIDHDHSACDGYINERDDGTTEYLFSEAALRRICGGKARVLVLKHRLSVNDDLLRDTNRPSTRRTIWASGQNRREHVVAIRASTFDNPVRMEALSKT